MAKVQEILNYMNELYPLYNAQSFDIGKVGLQFGNPDAEVTKIVLCLDATEEVINKAVLNNTNLIISHHPFMFSPLVNLDYRTNFGRKLLTVFKNDLNIMAFHTNFDVGQDGMNDCLAQMLGLIDIHYLTDEVSKDSLIRIGKINSMTLLEFSNLVKTTFNLDSVRVAGDLNKLIETVSIVGGSGSSEFMTALKFSDVLITGQIPHHLGIEAVENNFGLIEVTHAVEYYGLEKIKTKLKEKFNIEITISDSDYDPFKTI